MHTPLSPDPVETGDEALIRGVLREHAPADVDVERGWTLVASRCMDGTPVESRSVPVSRWLQGWPGRAKVAQSTRRGGWRRMALPMAAAMVLLVLLAGGGFLYSFLRDSSLGDAGLHRIESEHLYTVIGQVRRADGVAVSLRWAYADEGRTTLALDVQLDPGMAQRYVNDVIGSFDLSDQQGESPDVSYEMCDGLSSDGMTHCIIELAAFHPASGARQLTLTLRINQVFLNRKNSSATDIPTGPWVFQLTIPFHQTSLGALGPAAVPTRH